MKQIKTLAIPILTLWIASACATSNSATSTNYTAIASAVQSAAGSGNVTVLIRNNTATLVGNVKSRVDSNKAVRAAQNAEGINRVFDRITVRN